MAWEAAVSSSDGGEAALPTSHTVTPNGTVIDYHASPRRFYTVDGIEVPSVTTILKVLPKDALPWWGMKIGAFGVQQLFELGVIKMGNNSHYNSIMAVDGDHFLATYLDEDGEEQHELIDLLKLWKLTTNDILSEAGDRGTSVHSALEAWAAIGQVPDPFEYPANERGYVQGLAAFLADCGGGLEVEAFEVTVASKALGFAGRYDLLAKTTKELTLVTKTYPKRKSKNVVVPEGLRLLLDLKTSKHIYDSHMLQLSGYDIGMIECGHGPTDGQAVVHVKPDGRYEFRQNVATHEDYAKVIEMYTMLKSLKGRMKV